MRLAECRRQALVLHLVLSLAVVVHAAPARAAEAAPPVLAMPTAFSETPVPAACGGAKLALLNVDYFEDLSLPVDDAWQVFWNAVPLSDAQLAWMAEDDILLAQLRDELDARPPLIFAGMVTAAVGTAASSVGWALVGGAGDNQLSSVATLSLAFGGLIVGVAGVLLVSEFIQAPMQPFMTPTPRHRVTRARAQDLVVRVNNRLIQQTCGVTAPTPP